MEHGRKQHITIGSQWRTLGCPLLKALQSNQHTRHKWTFKAESFSETWTESCARAGHAYKLAQECSLRTVVVLPDDANVVSLECLVYSAWGDFWCAFLGTGCLTCMCFFAAYSLSNDPDQIWPISFPLVVFVLWCLFAFPWPRALITAQGKERVYANAEGVQLSTAQFEDLVLQPGRINTLSEGRDGGTAEGGELRLSASVRGAELANLMALKRDADTSGSTAGATATRVKVHPASPPYPDAAASNPMGQYAADTGAYPSFGGIPPYYGAPPPAYPPAAGAFSTSVPPQYLQGGQYDPTPAALAALGSYSPAGAGVSPRSPADKFKSAVTKAIAAGHLVQGGKRSRGARPTSDLWGSAFGQPQFTSNDMESAVAGMMEGGSIQDSAPPPTLVQFRTTLTIMGVPAAAANFWVALRQRLLTAASGDAADMALKSMAGLARGQGSLCNSTVREDVLHVAASNPSANGAVAALRALVVVLES